MQFSDQHFDFSSWREDMAETSRGAGRRDTYRSWTLWGNQQDLAKLRGLEMQCEQSSPTTTLSIGMESLGDSGSEEAPVLKKGLFPLDKPSTPLNIAGGKRKRDFPRASLDFEEHEIVLALGSPSAGGARLSTSLGLGQADSVGSGSGSGCSPSLTTAESEMQLGLKKFSIHSQDSLRLGLSRSSESEEAVDECGGFFLGLGQTDHSPLRKKVDPPVIDEGSSSARWRTFMPVLLREETSVPGEGEEEHQYSDNDLDMEMTCTGILADKVPRICKFAGCDKGARGASGLCIAHGGGRRCQKNGCSKGAEGRTAYCKAHGGGRRCQSLGCTKSAEGKTDFCIGHGGGRRCSHEGCSKAARGKSGLCIRHGGGKRCQAEGCTKSAEGYSGLCISHGGGRRCEFPACTKGAQGSTKFCKAHGGGKRCVIEGCGKGAEGSTPLCKGHGGGKRCMFEGGGICPKSVHGGTQFCVAHGGGKRCAVPECSKSARGRTAYCVRHGGGKRCKMDGCGKSAQGSTDFCKAHGGGKRCTWGQEGSLYGPRGSPDSPTPSCERFARGKLGLCASHSSMVQEEKSQADTALGPGLFKGVVSQSSTVTSISSGYQVSSGDKLSPGDSRFLQEASKNWSGSGYQQQQFPAFLNTPSVQTKNLYPVEVASVDNLVPEGRVHGGGLLAFLQRGTQSS